MAEQLDSEVRERPLHPTRWHGPTAIVALVNTKRLGTLGPGTDSCAHSDIVAMLELLMGINFEAH
jgi:hypothetical protein